MTVTIFFCFKVFICLWTDNISNSFRHKPRIQVERTWKLDGIDIQNHHQTKSLPLGSNTEPQLDKNIICRGKKSLKKTLTTLSICGSKNRWNHDPLSDRLQESWIRVIFLEMALYHVHKFRRSWARRLSKMFLQFGRALSDM